MNENSHPHRHVFPTADQDAGRARHAPRTPQTEAPAYRLAFTDPDFLGREELRPVRLQLELLKPELMLNDAGITSTVVLFGGARVPRPGTAARPEREWMTRFYDVARQFARLVGEECLRRGGGELVVTTGGGPGVMEAGSLGAHEVGAPVMGLSIVLPHEQAPNAYVSPELSFNFHYFGIRKMHFLMRAAAIAVFPGGFGTLDELFEALTLIQTRRMEPVPMILFGRDFWDRVINWQALVDAGTIAAEDLDLFRVVETAEEGWEVVRQAVSAP